jgi:chromate reductase
MMYPDRIHVLGIAGSLRERSLNRSLLEASRELAPETMAIEIFDLKEIPLYNQDLDSDELLPAAVEHFRQEIREADALLIATPEYNHSVPGVLQNALDWASRPARRSPLAGKPVAIMGAAPSSLGTARAQEQLRLVLHATLALVLPHPGVVVGHARDKFDGEGNLVDEPTQQFLASFLQDLEAWTRRVATPAGVLQETG